MKQPKSTWAGELGVVQLKRMSFVHCSSIAALQRGMNLTLVSIELKTESMVLSCNNGLPMRPLIIQLLGLQHVLDWTPDAAFKSKTSTCAFMKAAAKFVEKTITAESKLPNKDAVEKLRNIRIFYELFIHTRFDIPNYYERYIQ